MTQPTPDILVTTDWVLENASRPDVRIVEVDTDTELYDKGHIPGALAWNWTTDLNDPVRRDIASREQFEALLRKSGVTPDTTLVLYGDNNNWFAAFGVWLLNYYGHDRVKLLDGGRKRWEQEGRPLVPEVPQVTPSTYAVRTERRELRATRDAVLEAAKAGRVGLVDVRSPDEYTGKILAPPGMSETALRGGHIPGAVNVPWAKAVKEDGTFRSLEELQQLYGKVAGRDDVITYCRIGERSSHTWFVLHHLLGKERVRNYDGSWTEYGNLIGAPIRTGPEP
ncbi:MAG TPA: sulfurtransferase [Candidatus Thermoplasmatota archaeon]|nr:sulfurtransferase [Candidatus Thermoplasmatota archaeon]